MADVVALSQLRARFRTTPRFSSATLADSLFARKCPLGVKSGHQIAKLECPLYPSIVDMLTRRQHVRLVP